ncbi:MAG: BON domain-containing protein [Gemmatimonadota bacterium]
MIGQAGIGAVRLKQCGLLLLLVLGGCSALRRPPPVVDRSHDAHILQEVQARLAAEPAVATSSFRVEVDGGIVLLYGNVEGMGAWECAIRNAQLVPGVVTVVDYMTIERGPRDIRCLAPSPPRTPTAEPPNLNPES